MLYTICRHIRNFFRCVHMEEKTFAIEGGTISLPFAKEGQYILIEGSDFNDGLHKYGYDTLKNEEFYGTISVRAIPNDFLELVEEIEDYCDKHKMDNFASESFGGYSYTKVTNKNGLIADWQDVFRTRLNVWRCI